MNWVRQLGAHHVIDHSQPLLPQLQALGLSQVDHVASLTHTDTHYDQLVECLAPQGQLALIDDPASLDILKLKRKSLSLHWEFMYTRSLYETPDMQAQHELLDEVARLIDQGTLRTTLGEHYGQINASNLRRAHALLESGKARGKIVLGRVLNLRHRPASEVPGHNPRRIPPACVLACRWTALCKQRWSAPAAKSGHRPGA